MNAEFVDTELPTESDLVGLVTGVQNSSFIGSVGLQHGKAKVVVSCDRAGTLSSKFPLHFVPHAHSHLPSGSCQ